MKGFIKIKTDEAGKTIVLTGGVPSNILVCNIEDENTDNGTFQYDAETGEFLIGANVVAEISGDLFLITGTDENADLTINVELNGVPIHKLYTGINNQRDLVPHLMGLVAGDIVEVTVTSPDDVTIETDEGENYITIKRIY